VTAKPWFPPAAGSCPGMSSRRLSAVTVRTVFAPSGAVIVTVVARAARCVVGSTAQPDAVSVPPEIRGVSTRPTGAAPAFASEPLQSLKMYQKLMLP
jgi:hypothetical protein